MTVLVVLGVLLLVVPGYLALGLLYARTQAVTALARARRDWSWEPMVIGEYRRSQWFRICFWPAMAPVEAVWPRVVSGSTRCRARIERWIDQPITTDRPEDGRTEDSGENGR